MNYKKDSLYLVLVSFFEGNPYHEAYLKVDNYGNKTFYTKMMTRIIPTIDTPWNPQVQKYRKLQDKF